ncbi:MAG: hypothetical protein P8J88_06110 [Phycisphaerales bacterium]|nr:hypothetical protein [Phycisphaerales bacterium]
MRQRRPDTVKSDRRTIGAGWAGSVMVALSLGISAAAMGQVEAELPELPELPALPGLEAMEGLDRFVGEWEMEGITDEGRASMPGGVEFTAEQSVWWVEPGRSLAVEWDVTLKDGTKVSSGRGRITYDEAAGAVLNIYSGRDRGRPFTGSATLIGFDGAALDWRGHETSGTGASVNYEVTYQSADRDAWVVDFIPTCIDGSGGPQPGRFVWNRTNPFIERLEIAPGMIGVWDGAWQDAMGRTVLASLEITAGPGERSLRLRSTDEVDGVVRVVGDEIVWFDAASEQIRSRFLGGDGLVIGGVITLEKSLEGSPYLRSAWSGTDESGRPRSGIMKIELLDDRLTIGYEALEIDGRTLDMTERTAFRREFDRRVR